MALNISYNFVDGSPLNATQVNQNFEDIVNATSNANAIININSAAIGSINAALDIYTVQLTDFSSASSPTGWSSFNNKFVYYKKLGKTVYVWFYIDGTGSGTGASFSLPFNSSAIMYGNIALICGIVTNDNGSIYTSVGGVSQTAFTIQKDLNNDSFTNGTYRLCQGYFFYEAA